MEDDIEKVEIQVPILEIKTNTKAGYWLIIKDSSGKFHYFDKDGTYDGWSMETNINEN